MATNIMKTFTNTLRGLVTGALTAVLMTAFADLIALASEVFSANLWLLIFLPSGALLIAFTYRKLGSDSKKITTNAINEIHEAEDLADLDGGNRITPLMGLTSVLSCIFSHLLGASVGKEGAGVQLGFTAGAFLADSEKRMRGDTERDQFLMCGASAALSCLFGAPIAGTLFGAQIASPRNSRLDSLLFCLVSAYSSYFISTALGIHTIHIIEYEPLALSMKTVMIVLALGLILGVISRLICHLFELFKELSEKIERKHGSLNVFLTASSILILSLGTIWLTGEARYNGLGAFLITDAMRGECLIADFPLKLVFILLSLVSGFTGGEAVPLLILGSTIVSPLAGIIGLPVAPLSALGAVGLLTAGMKMPLVGFALGLELFGYRDPVLLFLMTVVAFTTSGKDGIYANQRLY